jgi:hypothetical protein
MDPPLVVATLESVDRAGRGLRVEFLRLPDRYAHRILAVGCEELPVRLLESVEETTPDEYPSSPVLQALNVDNLTCEDDGLQRVAMLVGMSTNGHWSLSIQPDDGDSPAVTFDAACRIQKIPKSLGSSYLWGERVQVEDSDHVPRLHFGSGKCNVELWDADSYGLPWVCDRHIRTMMFAAPGDPLQTRLPATVRWRYRMSIDGA